MGYYFVLLVIVSGVGNAIEKVGVYPTKEKCVIEAKDAGLKPQNSSEEGSQVYYLCVKAFYPPIEE